MEEQMTNNHTKKEARGIGDNAETPSEYLNKQVAYCYDALTTAVKYITRLTVSNEKLKNKLEEVGQCKNNWDRSLVVKDATDINVEDARAAIAYQMVMTNVIEKNATEAYDALMSSVSELSPNLSSKFSQALTRFNQINRSKNEDVVALSKVENKLKIKKSQLSALNNRLLKINQINHIRLSFLI